MPTTHFTIDTFISISVNNFPARCFFFSKNFIYLLVEGFTAAETVKVEVKTHQHIHEARHWRRKKKTTTTLNRRLNQVHFTPVCASVVTSTHSDFSNAALRQPAHSLVMNSKVGFQSSHNTFNSSQSKHLREQKVQIFPQLNYLLEF